MAAIVLAHNALRSPPSPDLVGGSVSFARYTHFDLVFMAAKADAMLKFSGS